MAYLLIIGARSDMASALARKYAANGYDLYLAARNARELHAFAADITVRTGRKAMCLELDVRDCRSHRLFYEALETRPAGVISAAGYLGDQQLAQTRFGEARTIIETNYTGLVSLINIIAADFSERQSGFIIGISSVAGDRGRKQNYLYGSAKAAFSAYLSGLRNALAAAGVQVITVKPGFVATRMTAEMDLPALLTARPERVADDIFTAQQAGKDIVYTLWIWRWIMLLVRMIPEKLFKRMNI
jgi:decaprenylphospho-beta-D-erythro-pentofuranosid-2-ulose 2-reductase